MSFQLVHKKKSKKSIGSQLEQLLTREISLGKKGFSSKKKEVFYNELGVLLQAGIDLKESLKLLEEEKRNRKDKEFIQRLIHRLVKGDFFSDSLKESGMFSEYEYYSIKIGEETGTLKRVMTELAGYYRRRNEQRRTVISALSYPIVVLTTAVLSVLFMLRFVVPMFAEIFTQNGVELPLLTKVIIRASESIGNNMGILFFGLLSLVGFQFWLKRKTWYQEILSKILLRIPLLGELIRKIYMVQFTQAVTLLTSSRVPLLNSIQLSYRMIRFYPLNRSLKEAEKKVMQGESLSQALRPHSIFDKKMISLLKVAEETNQNEYIFEQLTKQYNDEIEFQSKTLSTVLEPLIILVLGSIIALLLVAMYLPMFKLSTVLG